MKHELKNCPFCGGEPRVEAKSGTHGTACKSRYFRGRVVCKGCGASTDTKKSPDAMARAWNRRVEK